MEGDGLSESLETYAAKQAITEVLYRYCHAVDRVDADLASRIWHPDAFARYEDIFEGTGSGFMGFVFEQHRQADATSHQLANVLIDLDVDQGPGNERELCHGVHPHRRPRHHRPGTLFRRLVLSIWPMGDRCAALPP